MFEKIKGTLCVTAHILHLEVQLQPEVQQRIETCVKTWFIIVRVALVCTFMLAKVSFL